MSDGSKNGSDRPGAQDASSSSNDVVYVHGPTEDGQGLGIVRLQGDRVHAGELRAAKEGQPIHGELVSLTKRPEHDQLFDVEVLARGPAAPPPPGAASDDGDAASPTRAPHKGPALVASDAYRRGWEALFGRSRGGPAN
jgi:hypothetical protein